jgi:hypothetical protein
VHRTAAHSRATTLRDSRSLSFPAQLPNKGSVGELRDRGVHRATLLLALAVLAAGGMALSAATVARADPLPYTAMSPADGASISMDSAVQVTFEVHTGTPGMDLGVTVATRNVLGSNGVLANAYFVDYNGLAEMDAFGGYLGYSHPVSGWNPPPPGTYYWQIWGSCPNCGPGGTFRSFQGPVRRIVISQPASPGSAQPSGPDLTISRSEVRHYIRAMIHEKTNGKIRRLKSSCRRVSYKSMRCSLRWRINRRTYSGTARLFHIEQGGKAYWDYKFKGKMRKLDCQHRCTKRLKW